MQWVLWMIAVAILGLAAVAASGRLGELPGTVTDTPRPHLPTGLMAGDDLRGLRFAVVPRGYSMDQVDELLDRLARQLDAAGAGAAAPQATAPQTAAPQAALAQFAPAQAGSPQVPPGAAGPQAASPAPSAVPDPTPAADTEPIPAEATDSEADAEASETRL